MRSKIIGTVLALATVLAAVPAMAHEKDDAQYPMPAQTFRDKVAGREAKAREHMEARVAKLDAEKAKEVRAKFEAGLAKINTEVDKATADGTVTKEEAANVRQIAKEVRGHHHHKKDAPPQG